MKDDLFLLGEKVLREMRRGGADEVIVLPSERESMMVRFSNGKITVVQNWDLVGVDVLTIFGGRRIISRFEDTTAEGLSRAAQRVLKEASLVPEGEDLAPLPSGTVFPDRLNDGKIIPERINDDVMLAINAAEREGAKRVSGVFTASKTHDAIIGSNGLEGYDEGLLLEMNVRAFGEEGASGQSLTCGRSMDKLEPERVGYEAGTIVRLSNKRERWTEGRHDALLGPIIAANLLEDIGGACSAFSVEAGTSCLAGKVGEGILSERLTLADDGTSEGGLNTRAFDDEGTPTRRTVLVDRGTLKTYLHNTTTAKKFKASSTGNAGWVGPGPWNLIADGGDLSMEEALEELGNGIYVVSNWYTRFQNYAMGDFSTICRDGTFLVQNGEIKGALKGARISDNLLRLFASIKGMGRERRWVRWWEVRTPTLLPAMIMTGVPFTKAQES